VERIPPRRPRALARYSIFAPEALMIGSQRSFSARLYCANSSGHCAV